MGISDDARNRVIRSGSQSNQRSTEIYEMQSDHAYCELPDGFFARAIQKSHQDLNANNTSRKILEVKAGLGRHVITITSPF